MGSVSVSLPNDGETIDVADYNTPITTIVTAINGNLDSDNLAAGAVSNAKLSTTAGNIGGAGASFSGLSSGITIGNGLTSYTYIRVGNIVFANYSITFGSTSSVTGNITLALPVAAVTRTDMIQPNITVAARNAGVASYGGIGSFTSGATTFVLRTTGGNEVWDADHPFAFGDGDSIAISVIYEAAA